MRSGPLRATLVALLLFIWLGPAAGQAYRIAPAPAWAVVNEVQGLRLSDTACVSGGIEYLLVDRQYHLGQQAAFVKQAMRLTTAEGVQEGSRFQVDLDPSFQRLTIHALHLIRDGRILERLVPGQIRTLQREEDMDSHLYDGSITVVSDLQDVRVGDILEYAFTITGWNPADDGRFHRYLSLEYSVPLAHGHTRFIVPPGRTPIFRTTGGAAPAQVITTASGTEHVWDLRDQHCVHVDDGVPGWYDGYGALEVSEFKDVEELRRWALRLFAVDVKPHAALREHIAELARVGDPAARLDSAVRWVQRDIRYLGLENGIGAYRPHPPTVVLDQRFGDCKDKSLLLVTLLKACGIEAAPALVNTRTGLHLDERLPRAGMFDHCIVRATLDGRALWIDPTRAHNGGLGAARYMPDYGYALVVHEGEEGLVRMVVCDTAKVHVLERFKLGAIGTGAELTVETRYQGGRADWARALFAGSSTADLEREYTAYYARMYGPCEVKAPLHSTDDRDLNTFTTYEQYAIPQIWDTLADGTLSFSVLASILRDAMAMPDAPRRTAPFALGGPFSIEQRIEVVLPQAWSLDPFEHHFAQAGVRYDGAASLLDRTALLSFTYAVDADHLGAADASALYGKQKDILEDLEYQFTWKPLASAAAGPWPGVLNWGLIWVFAALSTVGAVMVARYDPSADASISGWRQEGIGGFLVLPAIGLSLAPFLLLFTMFKDGAAFLTLPSTLSRLSVEDTAGLVAYGLFTQAYNIALLAFYILLLVLFFRRRTSVPLLMKIMYAVQVAGQALDLSLYGWFDLEQLSGVKMSGSELVRSVVAAAIWIPVFHYSDRVKRTFVRRRGQRPPEPGWPSAAPAVVPVPSAMPGGEDGGSMIPVPEQRP